MRLEEAPERVVWAGGFEGGVKPAEGIEKEEAEKLADSLGDENDLEVLAQWLADRGFTHATTRVAWKTLLKRQEKIRRRSISLIRKDLLPVFDPKK